MPVHITARLAWHDDGWNGAVCSRPERNTYCVGSKSYPGDVIAHSRNLIVEQRYAGCNARQLKGAYVPPCCYSYNAFSTDEALAASDPPEFFYGGATRREWILPPATVCVWPYDAMYADNVKVEGRLDNDQRRDNTLEFFVPIEKGPKSRSLIFYYANYSNPFSEEEAQRYVLIGVSRITDVGEELQYEQVNDYVTQRYAGGMIWARNITSAYPNEGVRLPYHLYRDDPERLAQLALYPENPQLCKMGSRHLTDDDAIGFLEQFLARVRWLQDIRDTSENWATRADWLSSQIAKLWSSRGLYPGLLRVLEAVGAEALIDPAKVVCEAEGQQTAHRLVFDALERKAKNAVSAGLSASDLNRLSRQWLLLDEDAQKLLRDVLPRFDLQTETIAHILSDDRAAHQLTADLAALAENPYLLAEQYVGEAASDRISWSVIDRGALPSPELGPSLAGMDYNDARRFRAVCVEHLRMEPNHTFRFARELLFEITERMARLPDWKQAVFNERYFKVDAEFLSEALVLQPRDLGLTVYLRAVYEDERLVEGTLRNLSARSNIALKRPVTAADWRAWAFKSESPLALKATDEYEQAVAEQVEVCASLLPCPIAVVTGPAGTGKTTVIEALVRAIRKTEGEGASLLVLAPTGKATDRVREVFDKAGLNSVATSTVHSLLRNRGWLNDNLTFRRAGGKRAEVGTVIVDETSMLDLELAATLFRAIDWMQVRRLILVGDAGQLPPIGRGRVFSDIIDWLETEQAEGMGRLRTNIRQMLTRVEGRGEGVVELSKLFIQERARTIMPTSSADASSEGATSPADEALIEKLHAGGRIDEDLELIYWNDPAELASILIQSAEAKMIDWIKAQKSKGADVSSAWRVWRDALDKDPTRFQVLTPHRGELHGVEALNKACQDRVSSIPMRRVGAVDGVTLFDKVIQVRNRTKSNPIWALDPDTDQLYPLEIFNGEIGVTSTLKYDKKVRERLKSGRYGERLKRFVVRFARKENLTVGYGKDVPALTRSGKKISRTEKVEDNLELAYAVSVHKAQGSEFEHTFVIIPAPDRRSLSPELVYTAVTRAKRHCTLLVQRDISSLLDARRRENARTPQINSSLFIFHPAAPELIQRRGWYETGKIHKALSGDMVRSKSEVIIANLLHEHEVPFTYETPLLAPDGTLKLPDFTVTWRGETFYWEHLGMLDQTHYSDQWKAKRAWYDKWFPGRLLITEDGAELSHQTKATIERLG
ncbi:MAG TPA: AAA family ATPase [Beijerinckiaceae bacterium]|jgi:ATP-dependent exoDNAse (exonuclease V) alpha subunit